MMTDDGTVQLLFCTQYKLILADNTGWSAAKTVFGTSSICYADGMWTSKSTASNLICTKLHTYIHLN